MNIKRKKHHLRKKLHEVVVPKNILIVNPIIITNPLRSVFSQYRSSEAIYQLLFFLLSWESIPVYQEVDCLVELRTIFQGN
jgi:hypothetical protein